MLTIRVTEGGTFKFALTRSADAVQRFWSCYGNVAAEAQGVARILEGPVASAMSKDLAPEARTGEEAVLISCETEDGSPDIVLELKSFRKFGKLFSYMRAEFVADMRPCAPDGEFALSAPTGTVEIVGVVDRSQNYADHTGGVASFRASGSELQFAGGFNFDGVYEEQYRFVVNRVTGDGKLVLGNTSRNYQCDAVKRRF